MKKYLLFLCGAAAVFMSLNAEALCFENADNAVPVFNENPQYIAASSSLTSKLQALNNQLLKTDAGVQNSFLSLVSLLSNNKEAEGIKSKAASIMNNSSVQQADKSSMLSGLISDYAENLAANKSDFIKTITALSQNDKRSVLNNLASLSKGSTQYLTLARNYAALAASASGTTDFREGLMTAANASSSAAVMKRNASALSKLASAVSSLMR